MRQQKPLSPSATPFFGERKACTQSGRSLDRGANGSITHPMALSYKARRRWSLVILLIGLPAYIVAAVTILNWLDRPPLFVELLVYVVLGIVWALPFKAVFRGVGKADPEAEDR